MPRRPPEPHEAAASRLRRLTHGPTPTEEEVDEMWRAMVAKATPPAPASPLTGRPTPPVPDAYAAAGPLPEDPLEGLAEHRRRTGRPPRPSA